MYIGLLILLFSSCFSTDAKSQNDSTENKLHEFIELLFAEQSIIDINKIVENTSNENTIWEEFKDIEQLISVRKTEAISKLKSLLNSESIESRQKLYIYNQLRILDVKIEKNELLGIIIEFPNLNKPHLIAVYIDKRSRFINKVGEIHIAEEPVGMTSYFMDEFFIIGETILYSEELESGRDKKNQDKIKFNFLTSNGIKRINVSDQELEDDEQLSRLIWIANTIIREIILNKR